MAATGKINKTKFSLLIDPVFPFDWLSVTNIFPALPLKGSSINENLMLSQFNSCYNETYTSQIQAPDHCVVHQKYIFMNSLPEII